MWGKGVRHGARGSGVGYPVPDTPIPKPNGSAGHRVPVQTTMASPATDAEFGLRHQLNAAQMTMVAVGGSIGTGLLLGTAAIELASPAVILSFVLAAFGCNLRGDGLAGNSETAPGEFRPDRQLGSYSRDCTLHLPPVD